MSEPRGQWLATQEVGTSTGIALVAWTVRAFGRTAGRALVWIIALYYTAVGRWTKSTAYRASERYLAKLFPEVGFAMVFAHIRTFAQCALDRLFHVMGETRPFELHRTGNDHLEALERSGRGALLLGAHLGSFEVLRSMSRAEGLRLNILAHFANAKKITQMLRTLAPDFDGRVIEVDPERPHFVLEVKERIDAGELVAVLGDRTGLGGEETTVEFFGEPARFPTGPFLLAATLRCPVFLTFGLYHPPRTYSLYCEPFAERIVLPRRRREQAVRPYVQRYARRLEYFCRLAPYNWFNFFDIWE